MFLNIYCSSRIKARASILNKQKYIDNQFLHEVQNNYVYTTNHDGYVFQIEACLTPNQVFIHNIRVSGDSEPTSVNIKDILGDVSTTFIEYIAKTPDICIDADFIYDDISIHVYNGSKMTLFNKLEIQL